MVRSRSRPSSPPFASLSLSPSRLKSASAAAAAANATKELLLPASSPLSPPPDSGTCSPPVLAEAPSPRSDGLQKPLGGRNFPVSDGRSGEERRKLAAEGRCCGQSPAAEPSSCCSCSSSSSDGYGGGAEAKRNLGKQAAAAAAAAVAATPLSCGRQRLERHWMEVAGNVSIPERWGRENNLQEWVRFGIVEDALTPVGLMAARSALVNECQRRAAANRSRSVSAAPPVSGDLSLR